ncbi:type-1Aa cytolytic delta-endotoxin (plasmid) [Bacillus thuringiensis LM1212]|uniref:Insecticidal crystal protein 5 n=1 Tax=Bacillus thuringiensis TaxID=1428 RepID=A0A1C6ZWD3_BACTU|nr:MULTISPECIES: type-1Aa cytolytic delta-endotoxin [Bacillus cereus group]AJW76686.1 insecticidal crystal protein 5 [Bacillus thuringiensis]AXY11220.1 type-1Aa cytolytic delta-endotoxin [Bacillus thuringiensis LM1212]QDF27399.1 type-1Aa cytolytic delta-endotoxin [Bacillus tropicus]QUG99079.1 type-1Aa cytolytic delta-endotoxin [Bacillus tropicus]WFP21576.1 Cyt1A-like protein [Bacillus thuringiensis]
MNDENSTFEELFTSIEEIESNLIENLDNQSDLQTGELDINPWKTPQSNARVVVLRVPNPNEIINLLEITQIENPNYLLQAIELASAFQDALVSTPTEFGDTLRFSMSKGLEIAKTIQPKGAVVSYADQTITQTNNTVSVMIDKVVEILKSVMGVALSGSVKGQLQAAITNTFTNLNTQKDEAWIFWGKTTSVQTNYTYNVLFAIQNAETGRVMMCVPMGFEIRVAATKERVLFFTVKDSASYSVNIQTLRFAQPLVNARNYPISDFSEAIEGRL